MRHTRQPVTVVTHPLVATKLAQLRKPADQCPHPEFTRLLRELGAHMAHEVAKHLPTHRETIDLVRGGSAEVTVLSIDRLVLVPILRSGIAMAEGFREALPTPFIGHIGIHTNKTDGVLSEYLISLPELDAPNKVFLVIDPVTATGRTACAGISRINAVGAAWVILVSLVITDEGISRILSEHPKVSIYYAAKDPELRGREVWPGLGSMSKRLFGFATTMKTN